MCWADCFLCCFSLQTGAIFASSYMLALSFLGLLYTPFLPFSGEGNFGIVYVYMVLLFVTFLLALFGSLSESKFALLAALLMGVVACLMWLSLTIPSFLEKETPNCFGFRCGESHWLLPRQWAPEEEDNKVKVYTTPKLNLMDKDNRDLLEDLLKEKNMKQMGGSQEKIEDSLNQKRIEDRLNENNIEHRIDELKRTKQDRKLGYGKDEGNERQDAIEEKLDDMNEDKHVSFEDKHVSFVNKEINENIANEERSGEAKKIHRDRASVVTEVGAVVTPEDEYNEIEHLTESIAKTKLEDILSNEIESVEQDTKMDYTKQSAKKRKKRPSSRTKKRTGGNIEVEDRLVKRSVEDETEHVTLDYEEVMDEIITELKPLMVELVGSSKEESSLVQLADLLKNFETLSNGSYVRNMTPESVRRIFGSPISLDQLLIELLQNSESDSDPIESQTRNKVVDKSHLSQALSRLLHKEYSAGISIPSTRGQNDSSSLLSGFGNLSSSLSSRTVNHQKTIILNCRAHRPNSLVRPNEAASTVLAFLYGTAFLVALGMLAMYYGSFLLDHGIEKCCVSECMI